jgi:hypothetical protein
MCDAMRERACLPTPGTRNHKQRAFVVVNSLSLSVVKAGKETHRVFTAQLDAIEMIQIRQIAKAF